MKKSTTIDKSSLLLGLGTGMIIVSIAWFLFIKISNPNHIYGKNKILAAANRLNELKDKQNQQEQIKPQIVFSFENMQDNDNNFNDKNAKKDLQNEINSDEDDLKVIKKNEGNNESEANEPNNDNNKNENDENFNTNNIIMITVFPGDSCKDVDKRLYEAGLIKNKNEFNNRMKELKLTTKINAGNFKIESGEELDAIISKLVKSYKP